MLSSWLTLLNLLPWRNGALIDRCGICQPVEQCIHVVYYRYIVVAISVSLSLYWTYISSDILCPQTSSVVVFHASHDEAQQESDKRYEMQEKKVN